MTRYEPPSAAGGPYVGQVLTFIAPPEPVIGTVLRDADGVHWQRRGSLLAPSIWVALTNPREAARPDHHWHRLVARGPLTIVAVPLPSTERRGYVHRGGAESRNWLIEEFALARARAAQVPEWARPVVTRPLPAIGTSLIRRHYEEKDEAA